MIRLLISVEGHSEYKFVNEVVIPHLAGFDVFAESHNMKGKISIDRVGRKLNGLIHNYDFVTTLLYVVLFSMRLEGAVSLELLIVSISLNSFKTLSIQFLLVFI
jgi:hypothetical protein